MNNVQIIDRNVYNLKIFKILELKLLEFIVFNENVDLKVDNNLIVCNYFVIYGYC